jgi:hypothetical protein
MMQSNELKEIGEKIAQDYLTNGKDLTEGLDKVASTYGLNPNQISRVAEIANVKTHLGLIKQASGEDSYIEFNVADPEKVANTSEKRGTLISDYEKPPQKSFYKTAKLEEFFGEREPIEKRADYAKMFKEAQTRRESVDLLSNRCLEGGIRVNNTLPPMYSEVKQAALSGVSTESLTYLIKQAGEFGDYIIDSLQRDLKKDGITLEEKDFSKLAGKRINPENELFLQAKKANREISSLLKVAGDLQAALDTLEESDDPIEKVGRRAKVGLTSTGLTDIMEFLAGKEKLAQYTELDGEKLNNLIQKNAKRKDI